MPKDRYVDFLILFVTGCGFSFAIGLQVEASSPKPLACDGTPFRYVETVDKDITCYYKLNAESYITKTVKKRRG